MTASFGLSSAVLDLTALGIISAILLAMLAGSVLIARAFSSRPATLDVPAPHDDAPLDPVCPHCQCAQATGSTDLSCWACWRPLEDGVAAIATPLPFVDRELVHCPHCGVFLSSLTATECWSCSGEIASLDDGPRAA